MGINILGPQCEDVKNPGSINIQDTNVSNQIQNLINIWWYDSIVEIKEDGVFIDVSSLTRQRFMSYVDSVFSNNYYFEWLDYEIFSKLIFNPDHVKSELKDTHKIKLSDSISFISPERASKYYKPMIFWKNKDQAEYTFSPLFDEKIGEDEKVIEVRNYLNRDEFIARMWIYWVRFWLQISVIEEAISAEKDKKVLIAEALPASPWLDASLQTLAPLGQDLQIQTVNGKLDWKNYARVFPQASAGKKLYQKIPPKEGIIGMNIAWEPQLPVPPKDFDIRGLCGEWVSIVNENNTQYIVSSQDWYVQPVIWHYDSKEYWEKDWKKVKVSIEQIKSPVAVTRQIELGTIWPKTWNIDATWDVSIQGEVTHDYWVKAQNIDCIWDVTWSMYAKKDIKIAGNIIWSSWKQEIKFWQNGQNGQIVSENWDIQIQGKALSNAILQSQHGNVSALSVEASIVIGKNVHLKSLRSSIVIWENIEIEEIINSIIICSNKLSIKSLMSLKESGNIIFIIKPKEYKTESEKIWNQVQELTKSAQSISQQIESLQQKNTEIKSDQIVLSIMKAKKKQAEKQELTAEENKQLQEWLQWYLQKIQEYQANNALLKTLKDTFDKHNQALQKLWESFQELTQLQQNAIFPEIDIVFNQSNTKLLYLLLSDFHWLSSLWQETLSQLSHYKEMVQNKIFPIEMIQEFSQWKNISWKHK